MYGTVLSNMVGLVLGMLLTATVSIWVYLNCNKGMARNARGQQMRRFVIASLLVWLPMVVTAVSPFQMPIALAWLTGFSWATVYPVLFHLSNRRSSPDYEHYGEIACGIYVFGFLSALWLIGGGIVAAVLEWGLLMIGLSQVVYYLLYDSCVDANGMKIIQDTHYNEIIEFVRSYPWWMTVLTLLVSLMLLAACILVNGFHSVGWWQTVLLSASAVFFAVYIFKPHRGMFVRSGIVQLWLNIRDYRAGNMRYRSETAQRMQNLDVRTLTALPSEPHTLMVIIGESASRDYMSAFTKTAHDTTPWLRELLADSRQHTIAFPHAYSCAMHTVQVLEKSLTEMSQYNGKPFYTSCSIVDVAHKLGYRVHWYSNQGHLGAADTPITLVAETADVAKWTKQDLGKVQYDEELLGYLDELDPAVNNLLVLHLKGSHFNFLNRYPEKDTVWGEVGVQDNMLNYENSLHYTDSVMHRFFDDARQRFNLQAFVYFSDHGTQPDRHRSPNFCSFEQTRIPLVVWMSDEWKTAHQARWDALVGNAGQYWTNDLFYELLCGLMDVESQHFDETASLASSAYRYRRSDLLTFEGRLRIADDQEEALFAPQTTQQPDETETG